MSSKIQKDEWSKSGTSLRDPLFFLKGKRLTSLPLTSTAINLKESSMAKVIVVVTGTSPKEVEANTVGEVKEKLNLQSYTGSVNKQPADNSTSLSDGDLVTLSTAQKGGV